MRKVLRTAATEPAHYPFGLECPSLRDGTHALLARLGRNSTTRNESLRRIVVPRLGSPRAPNFRAPGSVSRTLPNRLTGARQRYRDARPGCLRPAPAPWQG